MCIPFVSSGAHLQFYVQQFHVNSLLALLHVALLLVGHLLAALLQFSSFGNSQADRHCHVSCCLSSVLSALLYLTASIAHNHRHASSQGCLHRHFAKRSGFMVNNTF